MLRTRVVPTLLLQDGGLVKGQQFKNHKYVGDPINAVKIFNDKEVDELIFLDISATARGSIDYELIKNIASEAFMPFGYGGGINNIQQIEKLFNIGVEKVVLNSSAFRTPQLITDAVKLAGSQSVVVSIDVKKRLFGGNRVFISNGRKCTNIKPVDYALKMEQLGVGELIVCAIDREGTGRGYDLELVKSIAQQVSIPTVALGGASTLSHLKEAVEFAQVSGVAAGDMFTFQGKLKAVLITYPEYDKLTELFK